MNREFYQEKAYRDSVRYAKQTGRPLSLWPSERHLLSLEDLPVVKLEAGTGNVRGFVRELRVRNDEELRDVVEVGRRYALLGQERNEWEEFSIGEWT